MTQKKKQTSKSAEKPTAPPAGYEWMRPEVDILNCKLDFNKMSVAEQRLLASRFLIDAVGLMTVQAKIGAPPIAEEARALARFSSLRQLKSIGWANPVCQLILTLVDRYFEGQLTPKEIKALVEAMETDFREEWLRANDFKRSYEGELRDMLR